MVFISATSMRQPSLLAKLVLVGGLLLTMSTATAAQSDVDSSNSNDPSVNGTWSAVIDWPLVPIHMILLKSGKVFSHGTYWDGTKVIRKGFYYGRYSKEKEEALLLLFPKQEDLPSTDYCLLISFPIILANRRLGSGFGFKRSGRPQYGGYK